MLRRGERLLTSGPLIRFFAQAGVCSAFTCLTSGVFLSGLAILMGAGDVLVSYLSVIVNICGVLILAFSAVLARFRSRKRLVLWLTALSRLATLLLVIIPAAVPKRYQLAFFLPAVVLAFTLQAQTTVVLNQWMMSFVDGARSGRYISLRQTLTLSVSVAFSLTGGWWMDFKGGTYLGFAVLFGLAGAMGAWELFLLARTPDAAPLSPATQKKGEAALWALARLPLKNRPFITFVLYIVSFYMILNIADSFTMVYMMKYLALPYQTVNLLYMIISLPQLLLLGLWGRISDRRGHHFVLKTSIWLFAGETLFMSLVSPESWFVFIPAAFLVASVANAGFVVAVFNRRYELMPQENRIAYDNFYTAAIGLGFILGPMLGGAVKGALESCTALEHIPFAGIRLLYPISTLGILLLQFLYLRLQRVQTGPDETCIGQ